MLLPMPQADRWHVVLCLVAAALWSSLLLLVPGTRTLSFGFATVTFLAIGLSQAFNLRPDS